jgi:hypothetical protein
MKRAFIKPFLQLLEASKLTTKVRKHSVLAGALGSNAAIKSHTFIFL